MSSFVRLVVAIRKAGLMDSMHVTEKFTHCRKNKPDRLSKLYVYCNCRVEPLDGSPTGLNHPFWLVVIKLRSDDLRNIESSNNVTPQYLQAWYVLRSQA